ncbi:hypothetical protein ACRYCC_13195 [Actinomadura scrupuli]|uniref:hypothetical protein n=1 Tax=Actinomadura scrupuli TaxID=559629 RepID=UPI003D9868B4
MELEFRHTSAAVLEREHLLPARQQGSYATCDLWQTQGGQWDGEPGWGASALVVDGRVKVVYLYYKSTDRRARLHADGPIELSFEALERVARELTAGQAVAEARTFAERLQALC